MQKIEWKIRAIEVSQLLDYMDFAPVMWIKFYGFLRVNAIHARINVKSHFVILCLTFK